eukprot:scaffold230291_cov35-Tisochrysis_lutea.AAC.2
MRRMCSTHEHSASGTGWQTQGTLPSLEPRRVRATCRSGLRPCYAWSARTTYPRAPRRSDIVARIYSLQPKQAMGMGINSMSESSERSLPRLMPDLAAVMTRQLSQGCAHLAEEVVVRV